MLQMFDFAVTQTRYIKAAADQIPSFRPDSLDATVIQAKVTAAAPVRAAYVTQTNAITTARTTRRVNVETLHDGCVAFLSQAQSVYRKNKNVVQALDRLPVDDKTFQQTITRADAIIALWEGLPQVGTPPADFTYGDGPVNVDVDAFTVLREDAEDADAAIPAADQLFQKAEGDARAMQADLDDFANAAIAQGRRYAVGSTERNIIDAIPDTAPAAAPGKAEIEVTNPQNADVHLEFSAERATSFDLFQRTLPAGEWVLIADDIIERQLDLVLPAGDYEFKATGRNSRGTGDESDVASLDLNP